MTVAHPKSEAVGLAEYRAKIQLRVVSHSAEEWSGRNEMVLSKTPPHAPCRNGGGLSVHEYPCFACPKP